jgi:1,4-alpha-glucan branching enzyme
VPLPHAGRWREVLNTDAHDYGGSGMGNNGMVSATAEGKGASALVTLPPLSTIMMEYDPE